VLYVGYLAFLLVLPTLVWWRWGLVAALVATALELTLVGLSFYVMMAYHLLPDLGPPEQQPAGENPMGYIRRRQAEGLGQLALFAILPGQAALAGGTLAVIWSALYAAWLAARASRK
jgi:hypothetical protein